MIENFKPLLTYEKFMSIPIAMYRTAGINLKDLLGSRSFWMALNFWGGMFNLNCVLAAEVIFIYDSLGKFSSFLEATAIAPCLGFGFITDFKAYVIAANAQRIMKVQETLKDTFPSTREDQERFRVDFYKKRMSVIMINFTVTYLTLIWVFNIAAVGQSIVEWWIYNEEFVNRVPFFTRYPFDMNQMTPYVAVYIHQMYAGHIAVMVTISADILMCSIVMQLVMHMDTLASDLRNFKPTGMEEDVEFLQKAIQRHQVVLSLCEHLNDIFSPSILFNFLASSMIICLVGFQVTAGVTLLEFCKYMLFLFSSLVQILLICYFGTMLMDSSDGVANAGYEHEWIPTNQKYKKLLIMFIMRAQKTAGLKVITFDEVSLRSFNKVCSIAYQFFALLRSVYGK